MNRFLSLCTEIEEHIARIYRKLAASSQIPADLRVILHSLADDEDDHAMQLRFAMRFPAGTAITGKKIEKEQLQQLLQRAKLMLQQVQSQELDARQAIELGIELEEDFCQAHIGNSMIFSDENLKKMFAALARDDKTHVQKLHAAKEKFSSGA